MWKRCCDRHERNEVSFVYVMNVTGIFRDDAMLWQITESVLINKVEEGKLINSKSEWNYVSSLRASSLFGSHARFILGASGGGKIGAGLKSGRERIGAGS